ncbi:LysR substrate-binding domain-containing protein [Herbaspirillum lusitanum]|jgi:LysR family glycine cleavage system transcriptional activator|uniref:LysR substrate-binding domain-containing protein n=1 Tax=Herbaspirillum lusitanum TaxID=213312 RepID=A0ABW9A4I9_9BURK
MKQIHRYPALRKASIKGLQAFEAAYMHRNFAAAAAELCVTASAVSHAIQALEKALDVQLFDRIKRNVVPTEAGARLFLAIQRSFTEIDREMRTIMEQSSKLQAVTIQGVPSFTAIWLMPRLPDFLKAHPEIDLRLWAIHQEPDFNNSGLDLAILYGQPPSSPGLLIERLAQNESYVPVCSPSLVEGRKLPLKPHSHIELPLIHNDTSVVSWTDWAARYAEDETDVERGLHLDRSFMSITAGVDGLGMCLESTLLVHEHLQQGKLVMPFGNLGLPAPAHFMCVPRHKAGLEKVKVVMEWIRSWLPAH